MKFFLCILFLGATAFAIAEEDFADDSARIATKLYEDCSKDVGFSVCLKKKAITFLDRMARMENVSFVPGINIVRNPAAESNDSAVNENDLEKTLPRALDAKEDALSVMLIDKLSNYVGSRTLEVSLPKFDVRGLVEEARKGDFDFDFGGGSGGKRKGGNKGGKNKKGGMMNAVMMLIGTKLAAFMGFKTIVTFLIATKALIIGKIALILSGLMLFRKFMGGHKGSAAGGLSSSLGWDSISSKGSPQATYGVPNTGGWQSGGWNAGGGYDRRSYDAQDLAYSAYSTTQK